MKYFIIRHCFLALIIIDRYSEFHELCLVGMVLLVLCDCIDNGGTELLSIWLRVHKKVMSNQIRRLKLWRCFNIMFGFNPLPITAVCWNSMCDLIFSSLGSATNTLFLVNFGINPLPTLSIWLRIHKKGTSDQIRRLKLWHCFNFIF